MREAPIILPVYLDARNPETDEIISTAREDGKASGVELPEEIPSLALADGGLNFVFLFQN